MHYYDQHLHTYFSFDSEESFENYLARLPQAFVSTDHFDLKNPYSNFQDDIPDYQSYVRKLNELASVTSIPLLKGIEIGVVPGQEAWISEYLENHPYDLKILSIHQNGRFDYMDDIVLTKNKFEVVRSYFDQMLHVLEVFHEGDIFAHFDYGLRRFSFTADELAEQFEGILIEILKEVIHQEMAFELNAKSFFKYQNRHLYQYVIPLYQNLGGRYFSLGSDAHQARDCQLGFQEMSQTLAEFHVSELLLIQGKNRLTVPLPFDSQP